MKKIIALLILVTLLCTTACTKDKQFSSSLTHNENFSSQQSWVNSDIESGEIADTSSNKEQTESNLGSNTKDESSASASASVSSKKEDTKSEANKDASSAVVKEPIKETGKVLVKGCKYTTASGKLYLPGEKFPEVKTGDTFTDGTYEYKYNYVADPTAGSELWIRLDKFGGGWGVYVLDNKQTSYDGMYSTVNGKPVTNLYNTFKHCSKMTKAPSLSQNAVNLSFTFFGCDKLESAPVIYEKVENMEYTFYNCKSLLSAPFIPDNVKNMKKTFGDCVNLTSAVNISLGAENISGVFENCKKLSGKIRLLGAPTSIKGAFGGTESGITLVGANPVLFQIANTGKGNISVEPNV